jgi:hypothetical protein
VLSTANAPWGKATMKAFGRAAVFGCDDPQGALQHGASVLPTAKAGSSQAEALRTPVPGDRMQMDTCTIRPGQFTAIDDCNGYPVAGWLDAGQPAPRWHLSIRLEEMPFSIQRVSTDRGADPSLGKPSAV